MDSTDKNDFLVLYNRFFFFYKQTHACAREYLNRYPTDVEIKKFLIESEGIVDDDILLNVLYIFQVEEKYRLLPHE